MITTLYATVNIIIKIKCFCVIVDVGPVYQQLTQACNLTLDETTLHIRSLSIRSLVVWSDCFQSASALDGHLKTKHFHFLIDHRQL